MTALFSLIVASMACDSTPAPTTPAAPAPIVASTDASTPIVASEDPKPPVMHRWTGAVSVGASNATGNTERTTVSGTGNAEYRREKDRTSLNFLWNYASEDDVGVTDRRVLGAAKYDYFINPKTYALAQASGEYDLNATLDLRSTLGVGIGRQLREDEKWKLSAEGGLSYFTENYFNSDDDAEYIAARIAYKADWKATEKFTLAQTGAIFPSLEDSEDVYATLDTQARLALTEKMFCQLQWIYGWDNTPAQGRERSDNLLLLTLGWSF